MYCGEPECFNLPRVFHQTRDHHIATLYTLCNITPAMLAELFGLTRQSIDVILRNQFAKPTPPALYFKQQAARADEEIRQLVDREEDDEVDYD